MKQTKKKGFEWYRMLTKKQQKQYRKNTIKEDLTDSGWLQCKLNKVDTAWGFICGSFLIQEREYWYNIITKLENK